MRVVHYHKSQLGSSAYTGWYASCFFIPDEQIVLFAVPRSSFGGMVYSITDQEETLQEARALITEKCRS